MASYAPLAGAPGYRCVEHTRDGEFAPGDVVSLDHINPLPMSDIMIGVTSRNGVVREFDYSAFRHYFQPIGTDA